MKKCTTRSNPKVMKQGEPCNLIMAMDVAALVDPLRHALLRSSGRFGKQIFEEIVELNQVALCVMGTTRTLKTKSTRTLLLPAGNNNDDNNTVLENISIAASLAPLKPTIIQSSITLNTIIINFGAPPTRLHNITRTIEHSFRLDIQTLRCLHCTADTIMTASMIVKKMCPQKVVIEVVDSLSRLPEGLFENCYNLKEFAIIGHGLQNITTFPSQFLKGCAQLISVDVAGFSNITSLGSDFMMNCPALLTIDLSFMSNVTKCGAVLEGCTGLTSIDLGPLSNLQVINGKFLKGCSGLTTIDLTPLAKVTNITKPFLSGCSKLQSVDMSAMVGMKGSSGAMCWGFLEGCCKLNTVDLEIFRKSDDATTPTTTTSVATTTIVSSSNGGGGEYVRMRPKITTVEGSFLSKCSGIVGPIDMSPLSTVTTIKTGFLFKCTGLKTLDLTPFSSVTEIGDRFLEGCKSLTTLNLSPLARTQRIGPYFLALCSRLTYVNISQLVKIKEIPDFFLQGCSSLKTINLTPFSHHVTKVGELFLAGCSTLKDIDLEPFSKVQTISSSFLQGCGGLVEVDTSPMVSLHTIGPAFLKDCCKMKRVDLSGFNSETPSNTTASASSSSAQIPPPKTYVTTIPAGFMRNCTALETIDLTPLEKVEKIQGNFMAQCSGLKGVVDLRPLKAVIYISKGGFLEDVPKGPNVPRGGRGTTTIMKSDVVKTALENSRNGEDFYD